VRHHNPVVTIENKVALLVQFAQRAVRDESGSGARPVSANER
jgi:hypothetical protein